MARKRDDAAVFGWMVVVVIVLAPFIWLYTAVGAFWFWVIVLGIPASALIGRFLQEFEKAKAAANNRTMAPVVITQVNISDESFSDDTESAWIRHCEKIEQAWQRGDYDWARQELQKIAYSMVGKSVTQEQKNQFTQVMKDFAKEDPLYKQVMAKVLPMVQANPGMMQSAIYKGQPDEIKEQMRYVLYFANELGHIRRVKKGNSYKLLPPGDTVESKIIDSSSK